MHLRVGVWVCVCVQFAWVHVCVQESQPISLDGVGQQLGVRPRALLCLEQQPLFYQAKPMSLIHSSFPIKQVKLTVFETL